MPLTALSSNGSCVPEPGEEKLIPESAKDGEGCAVNEAGSRAVGVGVGVGTGVGAGVGEGTGVGAGPGAAMTGGVAELPDPPHAESARQIAIVPNDLVSAVAMPLPPELSQI